MAGEEADQGKLGGLELWKALGSPTRLVAPMVDASELAWRQLARYCTSRQYHCAVQYYTTQTVRGGPLLHPDAARGRVQQGQEVPRGGAADL